MTPLLQGKERVVKLVDTDKKFIEVVTILKNSIQIKDPFPILRSVSSQFEIERDFGGLYNSENNSVVNFLVIFPLDEFDIAEEYQGVSWKELMKILQSQVVIERSETNLCLPNGRYHNDIVLDEMLCFTLTELGVWKVSSFVNAGD
jgi:hypothetical protein